VSNPETAGSYWQESAGAGRRGSGTGRRRQDSYGRADGYGRPAGNDPSGGYSRSDGYGREGGGRHSHARYDSDGWDAGADRGRGARGGYGRDAEPGGSHARRGPGSGGGSQLGDDLRSRLGMGSAPATGSGRLPGGGFADAYGDNGYGNGYGNGSGGGDDFVGYDGGGRRGGTGLRERTARFTESTRTRTRSRRGAGSGDGWDGEPPVRRKGSWWRHWTLKKAALVAAGMAAGLMLIVVAGVVYAYESTPIPTDVSEAALQQSSIVYFANGKNQVGTFSANGIDRQMLTDSQIPAVMKNAMVAAEDRHFYTEGGISVTGILRSAYEDIKGGGTLQGGSTLTEEFAKNYYATIGTSRTISTKIKEIFVSIKLSHEKSKAWIMTQYLNTVPFGDNAYGVAAASQTYFGIPALKLNVAQSAMLAAMVNQPGFFNPNPHSGAAYTALVARWHYVLNNMVRDGALTQAQANAQVFPKVNAENPLLKSFTGYRGYIMQAVENELESTYGFTQQDIDSRGLKIVTTFNMPMMNRLYRAVNQNLATMKAEGVKLPAYAHVGALLEEPGTGKILAMYGGPGFDAANCTKINCQYNMAMQSRDQVGSSFKPYVLATAVKEGMDVQDSVLNGIEPMCVPPDTMPNQLSTKSTTCPAGWFPVNIAGENSGALNVTKAAAISSDPAFEDLIHRAGTQATINMAKAFGVNTIASGLQAKKGEVGLALGIASLTVEEQATTFATLAADGEYVTPHVIAKITQANGTVVPPKITRRQVLTPAQAADVDAALSADTSPGGTAFPNGVLSPERPTIGKTGTTDVAQSAFFIGAIPQYALAVGMFTNSQNGKTGGQSLNILPSVNGQLGGFGGAWPTTIWRTFMQNQFGGLPIQQFATPDYVGFSKWIQVPAQPKPKPRQGLRCRPGQRRFGQVCPPSGIIPIPVQTPPNPFATPSPNATPTNPFGGLTVNAVPLGEEPRTTAAGP
jgi:membrane peptidoglycan carboxypeptidase